MDFVKEVERLERCSREYLEQDPGMVVDCKITGLIADALLPWIRGPEVLEMGFGGDIWTRRVIDAFGHTSIVDGSPSLLADARQKYGDQVRAHSALFEAFEPPHPYDTVLAAFVLEHVDDPVQVLRAACRWLTPAGHVVVAVPHADSFHRRLAVAMGLQPSTEALGPTDARLGHRRVYTVARMEQDIASAGLEVVEKRGVFVKFLPQSMLTDVTDAQLAGFMKLSEQLPMEFAHGIAFDCVAR